MRTSGSVVLVLGLFLLTPAGAKAGLYNTAEPEGPLDPDPKKIDLFRLKLAELRGIAADKVEFDYPLRKRYVLMGELASRAAVDRLSVEQKLDLSAVLLRRRRAEEALQLLLPVARQEADNLLLQSNLSMAYYLSGELRSASETAGAMVRGPWRPTWGELEKGQQEFLTRAGWSEPVYDFDRKVETYYVKLLRARLRESLARKAGKEVEDHVDPLFDDGKSPPAPVRFVNEKGEFEAGRVAAAEKAKLPADAVDVVRQLLVWMPFEPRLYWLLGELYNVQGKDEKDAPARLRAAYAIFDDLVNERKWNYRPREVVERHRALQERVAKIAPPPIIIDPPDKGREGPVDWRGLLVSFGAGVVVGVFVVWQVREMRRRRQARAGAHPPAAGR